MLKTVGLTNVKTMRRMKKGESLLLRSEASRELSLPKEDYTLIFPGKRARKNRILKADLHGTTL